MEIKVINEYITLGQLLKKADFIQSGGEAKFCGKRIGYYCKWRKGRSTR